MKAVLAAAALAGCATMPSETQLAEFDYGPAPDRDLGIMLIQGKIRETLKDPDSAQFVWPNGFVSGWYQRPFGKRYFGWITCGTVNAKNSYGGYVGRTAAIGVYHMGRVVEVNYDDATARYGTFVAEACRKIGVPAY